MSKIRRFTLARMFGISPSCLYYWEKTSLVKPSIVKGKRRFYTFKDVVSVKTIVQLRKQGISLQKIRRILETINRKGLGRDAPLSEAKILVKDKTVQVSLRGMKFDPYGQLYLDFGSEERAQIKSVSQNMTAEDWFERGCRLDDSPETMSQAEEAYLEALKLNKDFVPAMINLANIYYIQGRMFQAAMWYKLALKKSPENAEAHFNYANLLEDQGHLEEALLHYQMATVLKPAFAEAHYNLALIYEKLENPLFAYRHWKDYLKFSSDEEQKRRVKFYLRQKYKSSPVDKS